ncbi:unnamed protein product, partial [Rotaria magnacalcarata]
MEEAMDPATRKLINANNSEALEKKSYNSETTAEEILDNIIAQVYEEVERNDLELAIEDDVSIDHDISDPESDDEAPEPGREIAENVVDKILTSLTDKEEQEYYAGISALHTQPHPSKTPTTNPSPPKPMPRPRTLRPHQNQSNSIPAERSSSPNLPVTTPLTFDPQPSTSGIMKKRTPKRRLEFNPEDPPYTRQNGS